jgi:hypothetical protein
MKRARARVRGIHYLPECHPETPGSPADSGLLAIHNAQSPVILGK